MITEYKVFIRRKQGRMQSFLFSEKDVRKFKKFNQIDSNRVFPISTKHSNTPKDYFLKLTA